eukprot:NODE_641_length_5078_cov_0.784093.p4 type:complete len:147 gc:universal NODE_641_length_5078_cov_0.784093:1459-1899(+)
MRLTLYEILDLPTYATKKTIKQQFYKLSKQYHPDLSDGNPEKFKELQEAYSTLVDDDKRRVYDNQNVRIRSFSQRTAYPQYDLNQKVQRPFVKYAHNPINHHFYSRQREQHIKAWKSELQTSRRESGHRFLFGLTLFVMSMAMLKM